MRDQHRHGDHNDEACDDKGGRRQIKVVIDRVKYRAPARAMTGTELRLLAEPEIGSDRDLWRDIVDELDDVVENDEVVQLEHGMRFFTVPREINPGTAVVASSAIDVSGVEAMGLAVGIIDHGSLVHVTIDDFPLPTGYSANSCDLLLRLPRAFPDATPDMFWVSPLITFDDGAVIGGTQSTESYDDRVWQRWSRHIGAQWRPGIDDLDTYIGFVRSCLIAELRRRQ